MDMDGKKVSLNSVLRALRYSLGTVRISNTNRKLIFYEFVHALNRYGELDIPETAEILERADIILELG